MGVRIFQQRIDPASLHTLQNRQYSEKLIISNTAKAAVETQGKTSVSNLGHFLCQYITGHFETLRDVTDSLLGPIVIDDGVNHLRGQLIDGTGMRRLFQDYIPLDLILSPGRKKSNDAANVLTQYKDSGTAAVLAEQADKGEALFFPHEFEYLFSANSDILLNVKNDSDVDIDFEVVFHGIRILAGAAVAGI